MKLEIWSDIMCPFCYIGKRNFETALQEFEHPDGIEVEWKSFQLDPGISTGVQHGNIYQYLADRKGMSYAEAERMTEGVTQTASRAGLVMDFGSSVVANTFDAHRLLHLAHAEGLGNELKEVLFRAHFTDGRDVSNRETLIELGEGAGLDAAAIAAMLDSDLYRAEVSKDIREAGEIGVRGVPFFVFDRKYAVSGAQPSDVFLDTLKKSYSEWVKENPKTLLDVTEGPTCSPDGICD